jgi:hypothetical protein
MSGLHKFVVLFFNLNGGTSLRIEEKKLRVSKFFFWFNFVLVPFNFILSRFFYYPLFPEVFKLHPELLVSYSKFFSRMTFVVELQGVFLVLIIIFHQCWKNKKIMKFLELCVEVLKFLESTTEATRMFRKSVIKHLIQLIIAMALLKLDFLVFSLKKDCLLKSFVVMNLFDWNSHIHIYFLFSTFLILKFLIFALKSTNEKLNDRVKCGQDPFGDEVLSSSLVAIAKVFKEFSKTFGFLLSIIILHLVVVITVRVSRFEKLLGKLIKFSNLSGLLRCRLLP